MSENYEDLSACALTPELEEQLVASQRECVFMWVNKAGDPFGVVMAFMPKDGKIWMTAAETRKRISAIRRHPRASICITSTLRDQWCCIAWAAYQRLSAAVVNLSKSARW
jgi:general stress protein 26